MRICGCSNLQNADVDTGKHSHFTHTCAMLYSSYLGNTNKRRLFQFTATILESSLMVRPIHICCTLNLVMSSSSPYHLLNVYGQSLV